MLGTPVSVTYTPFMYCNSRCYGSIVSLLIHLLYTVTLGVTVAYYIFSEFFSTETVAAAGFQVGPRMHQLATTFLSKTVFPRVWPCLNQRQIQIFSQMTVE